MSAIDGLGAVGALRAGALTNGTLAGQMRSLRDVEPQPGITLQSGQAAGADFASTLKEVLGEVNNLQLHSDQMIERFAAGEVENLHEVVIAQQEAAIAFRLVQEMRDRILQGYEELMRTQV